MFTPWKKFSCLLLLLYLVAASAATVSAQDKEKEKAPKDPKVPKVYTPAPAPLPGRTPPGFFDDERFTSEKAFQVDPAVSIKLCLAEGELKINGWKHDEVRVFVKEGRKFRMKPLEKSVESGKANWLWIGNSAEGRPGPSQQCLTGERIEIDAPVGASFDISGRSANTTVDSVKKVKVNLIEGGITVRNVSGGIDAYTGQGDVTVENSSGALALESTTGNIVAVEVSPGQIGEVLRAKTNSGAVSLQRVSHRQIQASSISGSLIFEGKFLPGGIYNFRTSNGSIRLGIPQDSSCLFRATYGFGSFNSEIPLKTITEDNTPRAKTVIAKLGEGAATVSMTTTSGSIAIRRSSPGAL